jgi:hypothetical protein
MQKIIKEEIGKLNKHELINLAINIVDYIYSDIIIYDEDEDRQIKAIKQLIENYKKA